MVLGIKVLGFAQKALDAELIGPRRPRGVHFTASWLPNAFRGLDRIALVINRSMDQSIYSIINFINLLIH